MNFYKKLRINGTDYKIAVNTGGNGPPTTLTKGVMWQGYVDSNNKDYYICLGQDKSNNYLWQKVNTIKSIIAKNGAKLTTTTEGNTVIIDDTPLVTLIDAVQTKANEFGEVAAKAQTIADIAKLNVETNAVEITSIKAIVDKNAEDISSLADRIAIEEGKIGTLVEGKTIVDMINDVKTSVVYDDTLIKAEIKKNADAITILNADSKTEGSVDYKVAQEVAKIINDNDSSDIDTLNEIVAWITNDTTGVSKMHADIVANASAITKLNADANTEGSVLYMIEANKTKVATVDIAGLVKSVASTVENGISVAEDGTMSVNSVNVNKLVQDEGSTIVLNGGSSNN